MAYFHSALDSFLDEVPEPGAGTIACTQNRIEQIHIMINAYIQVLKNYWTFSGRTKRSDFWLFVLTQSIIFVIGLILSDVHDAFGVLLALYFAGTLLLTTRTGTAGGYWREPASLR